jgi:serine/threonine-protein kinase HipA
VTSECFVYIALPGETDFVTAGRFRVDTDRHGIATGRLVYGKSYLARKDAVPIDPIELKLASTTYETRLLKGIFGPRREFNRTIDLQKLQDFADRIIAEEDLPQDADAQQAKELLLEGTSMGGARPKAVVEDDGALWIAKFNRPDDKWNHARVERAMLELARACGLHTAETRLTTIGDRDALLVKRFDRERAKKGYRRARMLSALTLLRAEDTHTDRSKWSYVLLVEELRRISARPKDDAPELFKRMCFNALISNSDDHPRNHAVIAMENDWRLSPAYDLTPSPQISIEHRDLALACGDMGRYAHADNLRSQSARFLVNGDEAKATIDAMEQTVKDRWYEIARREGVSEKNCETIRGAFAYEGFRLELPTKNQ